MTKRFPTFVNGSACFTFLVAAVIVSPPATAQSTRVISVEEHWTLKVSEPDTERSAPQVTMVMSPNARLDGLHFLFTLNHANGSQSSSGGLQVQSWVGTELDQGSTSNSNDALDQSNEVISWTQRLSIHDGNLRFQIVDGESLSWGNFGGDGLSLSVSSQQANLNSYRPSVSLTESQVNYAENRVVSLTLTKLVWTTEDGVVHEQNAPIPIDTSLDE